MLEHCLSVILTCQFNMQVPGYSHYSPHFAVLGSSWLNASSALRAWEGGCPGPPVPRPGSRMLCDFDHKAEIVDALVPLVIAFVITYSIHYVVPVPYNARDQLSWPY